MTTKKKNLELVLEFLKDTIHEVLRFLETHKFCRRILFLSLGNCMVIWSLALNADNIIKIISLIK